MKTILETIENKTTVHEMIDLLVYINDKKLEAQKDLLEKIKKQNTFTGNAYLITKKDMDNLIN